MVARVQQRGGPVVSAREREEYNFLALAAQCGDPLPWIERYLKIAPEQVAGKQVPPLVPMLLSKEPNQLLYYGKLFPQGTGLWPTMDVLVLKDRKARWTSFWTAVLFCKMRCLPGTHVLCIADAEDRFGVVNGFMAGYYHNMPAWCRPVLKGGVWAQESNTFIFEKPDGGIITSTFMVRTANSPNVGTGETPTDIVLEEYPKFPATYSASAQASFRASMKGASFLRGGSVGPNGSDCAMYDEIAQYKEGQRQLTYIFTTWFQNPANALPPGHPDCRPADLRDEDIEPGKNAGLFGEEEIALEERFPEDGTPIPWRLRQRRAWVRDAELAAKRGDGEPRVLFQREHCEDDMAPWLIAGRGQFDDDLMKLYGDIVLAQTYRPVIGPRKMGGLVLSVWAKYNPAHVYILGVDLASGNGGDYASGQLMDFTDRHSYIGELHGNTTDAINAVAQCVGLMREWGSGVIVGEINHFEGVWNYAHNPAVMNADGSVKEAGLGYENIWKPPRRSLGGKLEPMDDWYKRYYGMRVGDRSFGPHEPSKAELLAVFKSEFNLGNLPILNPNLFQTMRDWDPNRDKHTPDRIAGACLCPLGYDRARSLQPITGAAVVKPMARRPGFGPRRATGFQMVG